jgi:hypothetical protein
VLLPAVPPVVFAQQGGVMIRNYVAMLLVLAAALLALLEHL